MLSSISMRRLSSLTALATRIITSTSMVMSVSRLLASSRQLKESKCHGNRRTQGFFGGVALDIVIRMFCELLCT
jgi:hypothetical protein